MAGDITALPLGTGVNGPARLSLCSRVTVAPLIGTPFGVRTVPLGSMYAAAKDVVSSDASGQVTERTTVTTPDEAGIDPT